MDWDALRYVLAVYREGTLVGAARALDVSVSTVSRQMDRAEEALNTKLFDRRHKGMFPTAQGNAAVKVALGIEQQMIHLHQLVEGTNQTEAGMIRLSMPLNVMSFGLADDIRQFQRAYPDITFQIHASDEPLDFADLEVDVVLRVSENPPTSLWGYRIAQVGVGFYASRQFMAEWGDRIENEPEAVPVPFVCHLAANPAADRDEFLSRFPNAVLYAECNGLDSLIPMVNGGAAAGRMMHYMARRHPNLVKLFDCHEQWTRTVWILTHRDLRETRRIRLFMEFIRGRFEERMNDF